MIKNILSITNGTNQRKFRSERILLIDADAVGTENARLFLGALGFRHIHRVRNGKEALALISNQNFDLILVDLELPDMTGFKFSRFVRKSEHNHATPIIAHTVLPKKQNFDKCLKAGMNDYLKKFCWMRSFKAVINHWCSEK